jgi:hypothetical protein
MPRRRFHPVFFAGPEEPFAIIRIDYKVSFESLSFATLNSRNQFWIQDAVDGLHDYDEGRRRCLTNHDRTYWEHFFVSSLHRASASC